MKNEARVVVIGGGIVGVAVLYHLTKLGWKDVVLVERKQLTAGSTWHAAAGFHSLNGSLNMAGLQHYSIHVYDEIQEISGQDVGIHRTGSVSVAASEEWWDFLQIINGVNQTLDIDSFLIDPSEVPKYTRIIDPDGLTGAMIDTADGHLDPYGATHAYAKSARIGGAEIYQQTLVTDLVLNDDDTWNVVTDKGTIHTQHVVNAAGLWARGVARMAGHEAPLIPYEHHYLVTEPIPKLAEQDQESMTTVDLDAGIYVRQELGGLLFGVYEPGPIPWALDGSPWTYGESELLRPRLDDLADSLDSGFRRFPMMQDAGIKNIVNGPFTFTPDGNPLVGPVRGLPNYWMACGVMAGFSQSGGVGLTLAQWMIDGEPEVDTFMMDPARFGSFANEAYTLETSTQFYEWRFKVPFPNEPWPAGRPAKTTPIFDLQRQAGAVFAPNAGLEVPMWFAREGDQQVDVPEFRRGNFFEPAADEVMATTNGVGLLDISSYSKFEVSGPGARTWLDSLLASRLPRPGRGRLGVMLSPKARIVGDFTVFCLATPGLYGAAGNAADGAERFLLTGSGPIQEWHMRWFSDRLPADGSVRIANLTDQWTGLALAGPAARDVLQRVTRTDVGPDAFRFLDVAEMNVGRSPAVVDRVSLTGELGYEIWVPSLHLRDVYTQLLAAGADHGIRQVGVHALLSMRLEKAFGIWGREYSPDYTPSMNEMHRFVDWSKGDFVGRAAAIADRDSTPARTLHLMEVDAPLDDASASDATGFEPIFVGDDKVGFVTSGGFGHRSGRSLAMAYLDAGAAEPGLDHEVLIIGERRAARMLDEVPFDPSGTRMRS